MVAHIGPFTPGGCGLWLYGARIFDVRVLGFGVLASWDFRSLDLGFRVLGVSSIGFRTWGLGCSGSEVRLLFYGIKWAGMEDL